MWVPQEHHHQRRIEDAAEELAIIRLVAACPQLVNMAV
jgi:hypothetical protein